jgi:cytochrome c oxidase subunit 4
MSTSSKMNETIDSEHHSHPSPGKYFKIAITLVIITAIEVGVFYVEELKWGIIPVLLILSGLKFGLVAMFYMHLKYDSKLFSNAYRT